MLNSPRGKRNVLSVVVWVAIAAGVFLIREVLTPFVIGISLAYVIDPVVTSMSVKGIRGRKIPRWGGVLLLYVAGAALTWLLVSFFVPQIYRELVGVAKDVTGVVADLNEGRLFTYANDLEDLSKRMRLPIKIETQLDPSVPAIPSEDVPDVVDAVSGVPVEDSHDSVVDEVPLPLPRTSFPDEGEEVLFTVNIAKVARSFVEAGTNLVRAQTADIVGQVQVFVGGFFRFVFSFFLVLMITAFLSVTTERTKRFVFTTVPVEDREKFDAFLERLDRGLSGVVRGQLTICVVNGFLTLIGLLILKVKFAFLLATVAMVFSLVPVFGSIISTVPIVIVAIASSFTSAVLALLWIVGVHFLEANVLNPKIMGDAAKIHPALVVLALITGEHFYGLFGALFAVPVMSILITIVRSIVGRVQLYEAEITAEAAQKPRPRPVPRGPRIWREPRA